MNIKKPTSPAVLAGLEKARSVLNGRSPRAMGVEKQALALNWIYRWGWSSPAILDIVTSGARSGISLRLLRNKLLVDTATASGGVQDTPKKLLTLSQSGLEESSRHSMDLIDYELNPYRIDQTKLRHDGLTQMATARALENGSIVDFKTPNELAAKSSAETKQPDVLWINGNGKKIGIEVELTPKWEIKLDQFVHKCLLSISPKHTDRKNAVDEIYIISDSKAIIERYTAAFTIGKSVDYWQKNERGYWIITSKFNIESWADGKVTCSLI